jgi:enoyl-CoA hydratase
VRLDAAGKIMSENILLDEMAPGVRRITFNRPDSYNAFLDSMYGELIDIFAQIARDTTIRVVVITGAGKGFCSGQDTATREPKNWVPDGLGMQHYTLHYVDQLEKVLLAIRNLPQPVIAAVNGPTAGYGYSLALACDLAIASSNAKFVNAFHNAWTGAEAGLSYLLPHAVGAQRAAELLLTTRPVLAHEAERIGLVLRVVPPEQLMNSVLEMAELIKQNAPLDVWLTKQNLHRNLTAGSFEQAVAYETRGIGMAITTQDAQERRAARRDKRPPSFRNT